MTCSIITSEVVIVLSVRVTWTGTYVRVCVLCTRELFFRNARTTKKFRIFKNFDDDTLRETIKVDFGTNPFVVPEENVTFRMSRDFCSLLLFIIASISLRPHVLQRQLFRTTRSLSNVFCAPLACRGRRQIPVLVSQFDASVYR